MSDIAVAALLAGTIEQLSETIDHELRQAVESVDQVFLDATPRRS